MPKPQSEPPDPKTLTQRSGGPRALARRRPIRRGRSLHLEQALREILREPKAEYAVASRSKLDDGTVKVFSGTACSQRVARPRKRPAYHPETTSTTCARSPCG